MTRTGHVYQWLLVVLASASCINADVLRLDTGLRPATDPATIRVLAEEPTEPYAVIAVVSVSTDPPRRSVEALRERLQREAAKLGGHAVLLDGSSLARTSGERRLSAKVIVFER